MIETCGVMNLTSSMTTWTRKKAMSDKTLTFTAKQLAEALNDVRCMYDLSPELIAEEVFAAVAQQPTLTVPEGWKLVPVDPTEEMLSAMTAYDGNYYTHPFDEDDFAKDYAALLAAAPAAPVARPTDAMLDDMRRRGLSIDGDNAYKRDLIDCIVGALMLGKQGSNPPPKGHWAEQFWQMARAEGEIQERLTAAPPATEQPECVTCSGHGLVGNRLDDAEECPECHGAGIIYGTECGACAEQPDTVAVPRELLEQAEDIVESYAESLKACHAPGGEWGDDDYARDDYEHEAGLASKLRALLDKEGEA